MSLFQKKNPGDADSYEKKGSRGRDKMHAIYSYLDSLMTLRRFKRKKYSNADLEKGGKSWNAKTAEKQLGEKAKRLQSIEPSRQANHGKRAAGGKIQGRGKKGALRVFRSLEVASSSRDETCKV